MKHTLNFLKDKELKRQIILLVLGAFLTLPVFFIKGTYEEYKRTADFEISYYIDKGSFFPKIDNVFSDNKQIVRIDVWNSGENQIENFEGYFTVNSLNKGIEHAIFKETTGLKVNGERTSKEVFDLYVIKTPNIKKGELIKVYLYLSGDESETSILPYIRGDNLDAERVIEVKDEPKITIWHDVVIILIFLMILIVVFWIISIFKKTTYRETILTRSGGHRDLAYEEINLKSNNFKRLAFKIKANKPDIPYIRAGIKFVKPGAKLFLGDVTAGGTILFHIARSKIDSSISSAYRPAKLQGDDFDPVSTRKDYVFIEVFRDKNNFLQFKIDGDKTKVEGKETEPYDSKCKYFEKFYWHAWNNNQEEFEVKFYDLEVEYYK